MALTATLIPGDGIGPGWGGWASLAAGLMLDHVGESVLADRIRVALSESLHEGTVVTGDLGGNASTEEFASAVIEHL